MSSMSMRMKKMATVENLMANRPWHGDRVHAALERLRLHRRQAPRRDELGDAEQRAGDERREGECHENRRLGHCNESRGAGTFGGWPEMRCEPARSAWRLA